MTDNNTFLAVSPADLVNIATETIDCKIPCLLLRFLFLVWTTLNITIPLILWVGRKWKVRAGDNYKGILNIEFEEDRSFTLGATLGDGQKIEIYFSSFRDFSGKSR